MLTILCVLKSGGDFSAKWVGKLRRGVTRHINQPFRFVCLSDVDVPCERIPLQHNWPGWWSKIEIFRPGVVCGPTLYMDLDTVITGSLEPFLQFQYDFAMIPNFNTGKGVGSALMWFKDKAPDGVYEKFAKDPEGYIAHHNANAVGSYLGDQAFISDAISDEIPTISSPAIRSYKVHCNNGLPEGTSIVCFHRTPRPSEVRHAWVKAHWR